MLLADGLALFLGIRAARLFPARRGAQTAAVLFVGAGLGSLIWTLAR